MISNFFNYYNGALGIQIIAPKKLSKRISNNLEGKVPFLGNVDCNIKIQEADFLQPIKKDKRFEYSTVEKSISKGDEIFRYYRYDTPIRTVRQKQLGFYEVNTNVPLDENSALICLRNQLSNSPNLLDCSLLHASLVNIDGEGVLVAGDSMQGKTSLATYLLQEKNGIFIGDENILLDLSGENLKGIYVPRTVRVRFPIITNSNLSKSLEDISLTDSTQYLDSDYIEEVLKNRDFPSKWGLTYSRKSFCDLLNVDSKEDSEINTIIFPAYKEKGSIKVRLVGREEGIEKLSNSGLIKKTEIDHKELEDSTLNLNSIKDKKINFIEVSFSGFEELMKEGFKI